MDVYSRYPVRHKLLLAGAESVPQVSLIRVTGYRRSPRGRHDAHLFAPSCTLRIRQIDGLDFSIADSTSPLRTVAILPLRHFHEVSRAAGPNGQIAKLQVEVDWLKKKSGLSR
jgi:hypothetical protein